MESDKPSVEKLSTPYTNKKQFVQKEIYASITNGIYRKGEKIPSCRAIARQLNVSKNSVYEAYMDLVKLGVLEAHSRSGFKVAIEIESLKVTTPDLSPKQKYQPLPLKRRAIGSNLPDPDERALPIKFWADYPYPFVYNQIDSQLFPLKTWRACSNIALRREALPLWTSEAIEVDSPDLIIQLRQRLLQQFNINANEDEILITVGAQHALSIIATLFADDPRPIAMEDPGYQEARHMFHMYNNTLAPVPVDNDGLDTDQLPEDFKLAYVTPSRQFPSMVTMSKTRKEQLISKAKAADALIIEDNYESGLTDSCTAASTLKSIDDEQSVIYIGSLSKTLSPSIRVGYMVAHRSIIKAAKTVRSLTVRHSPSIIQETLAVFFAQGYYDSHLKKMRQEYTQRWIIMRDGIDTLLPMVSRSTATGGTSFWLTGEPHLDSRTLAYRLQKSGVLIEPGDLFYYRGNPKNAFRISFPSVASKNIIPGIKLIAKELAHYI